MTGNKRLKISIFSLIAVAVLFVTAVFSVSYAKWSGGSTEATAKGSVGKYYVEYPYTAQSSQVLEENTYYLAVQNKSGITDYYKFGSMTSGSRYVNNVYIKEDTNVTFTYGTDVIAEPVYRPDYNTGFHGSYDTSNKVFTTAFDAVFDFGLRSGSGFFDIIIQSKYPNIIELEFDDRMIELLCQTGSINVHMWHSAVIDGVTVDTDLTPTPSGAKKWPGQTCTAGYSSTATTAGNTNKIDLSGYASTDNVYVIFNYIADNGTSYWQTTGMKISDAFGASDMYYLSFSEGTQSGTNYPLNMEKHDDITPSVAPVSAATDASDDMIVRKVSASTNADNSYTYKNYVCVSREYLATQTDKTAAYVNFGVEGIGGDELSANVTGFTVKRAVTDADGNIAAGDGTAEFVYNSPEGKTLADINAKPPTGEQTGEHLKNNYVIGGTYVMLYFGEGKDRYYALDVTITTDSPANFTLTATASNVDRRHRYKTGYGEKLGYYLGGEFNGMDMWNPRFAAKLEKNGTYAEDAVPLTYKDGDEYIAYSGPSYVDVSLTIQLTAANDTVKLFRLNNSDGKRENGTAPTLWFIPHHIHKNYTDGIGVDEKKNLFNADMNLIVAVPGTYRLHYVGNVTYKSDDFFAYDRNERVYLTKTEYYALYAGGGNPTDSEKEAWIDEHQTTYDGTKRYTLLGNWNGVVDNLYVERIGGDPDKLIENVTVTFDPNGGTWDVTDNIEPVEWGATLAENGLIRSQPTPPAGKMFDGWYDSNGKQYDSTTKIAPSSATLTLTAKWVNAAVRYTVTFDANGGTLSGNDTATTGTDGKLSALPANPTRSGYTFVGWYIDGQSTAITTSTVFEGNTTAKARWKTTVTYNLNGAPQGTVPSQQEIIVGNKIDKPTDPVLTGHIFVGWYRNSTCVDTDLWNFDTDTVSEKTTLYAKFEGAAYSITSGSTTEFYAPIKEETTDSYYVDKEIKAGALLKFYKDGKVETISTVEDAASMLMSVTSGNIEFTTEGKYKFRIKKADSSWNIEYEGTGFRLIGVLNGVTNWDSPGRYEFVEITPKAVCNNNTYVPPKMYALTYTVKTNDEFRVYSTASGSAGWLTVRGDSPSYSGWGSGNIKPSVGWKCNIYVLVHANNTAEVVLTNA